MGLHFGWLCLVVFIRFDWHHPRYPGDHTLELMICLYRSWYEIKNYLDN